MSAEQRAAAAAKEKADNYAWREVPRRIACTCAARAVCSRQASMGGPSPNVPYNKNDRGYGDVTKMCMGFLRHNGFAQPVTLGVGGRLQKPPEPTSDDAIIRCSHLTNTALGGLTQWRQHLRFDYKDVTRLWRRPLSQKATR